MISPHSTAVRMEGDWCTECSSRGLTWICVLSEYLLSTYHEPVTGLVALETLENKIEEALCTCDANNLKRYKETRAFQKLTHQKPVWYVSHRKGHFRLNPQGRPL